MYRFMLVHCQEKNAGLQTKNAKSADAIIVLKQRASEREARLEDVMSMQDSDRDSRHHVVPTVGDHARSESAANEREQTEEAAVDADEKHAAGALVCMCGTEADRGE